MYEVLFQTLNTFIYRSRRPHQRNNLPLLSPGSSRPNERRNARHIADGNSSDAEEEEEADFAASAVARARAELDGERGAKKDGEFLKRFFSTPENPSI